MIAPIPALYYARVVHNVLLTTNLIELKQITKISTYPSAIHYLDTDSSKLFQAVLLYVYFCMFK